MQASAFGNGCNETIMEDGKTKALCFADDGTHIIQTCENIMGMYKKDGGGSKDEDINNAFLDQLGEHLLKGGSAPTDLPAVLVLRQDNKGAKCYRRHTGPVHSTQRMFEPTMSKPTWCRHQVEKQT